MTPIEQAEHLRRLAEANRREWPVLALLLSNEAEIALHPEFMRFEKEKEVLCADSQ